MAAKIRNAVFFIIKSTCGFSRAYNILGGLMNHRSLTLLITAIANYVADAVPEDRLALIAAALTQLADTIATIATQRDVSNV